MTIKILLLGDSFADPDHAKKEDFVCYYHELTKHYQITNFGLTGSNLQYSYRLYQIHKNNYDKVIVMVTAPGRLRLPEIGNSLLNEMTGAKTEFLPNLWTVRGMKLQSHYQNANAQKILSAAEDYFLYLSNAEDNMLCQDLMVEKMKNDNTLLLPCFKESWTSVEHNLFEISNLELTGNNQKKMFPDVRPNHFNVPNHRLLASALHGWIGTGQFYWNRLYSK